MAGADISWMVGLAVPALLYWAVARRNTAHIPERTLHGTPAPVQEPVSRAS